MDRSIVIIPEGNKRHFFKKDDIIWIKSDKYYVNVHSLKEKCLVRITLKKVAEILPPNFVRTNRSTLININSIRLITKNKVNSTVTLKNNMEFSISNTYCENIERLFG